MKRKTYEKKMRGNFVARLRAENGGRLSDRRQGTPNWGHEITVGVHKGEKCVSYKQAYESVMSVMGWDF